MSKRFSILLTKISLFALLAAGVSIPGFAPVATILVKAQLITSDNLGNLYTSEGNTIRKYNINGNLIAEYTNTKIDKFDCVDASDPLKTLLFTSSSAEIMRLDNKFAQQGGTTRLFELNILSPKLACNSYDIGAWVWDDALNEIIRINQHGSIDTRTRNLINISEQNPKFAMILEKDFLLYASDPDLGIFVFDRHGNFVKKYPLINVLSFQLVAGRIVYYQNGHIVSFDSRNFSESNIKLPAQSCKNAIVEGKHLFIHYPDSISIFISNQTL